MRPSPDGKWVADVLRSTTAAQRMGVPSECLHFPYENHWMLEPARSIQWHETVLRWIARRTRPRSDAAEAKVRGSVVGQMGAGLDKEFRVSRSGEHVAQRRPLSMRQAAAGARREFRARVGRSARKRARRRFCASGEGRKSRENIRA
jgi:hypothetical protein